MTVEWIDVLAPVIASALTISGTIAWQWWRRRADQARTDANQDLARMSEIITQGMESSDQARQTVYTWLLEERERAEECKREQDKLRVEIAELRRELTEERRCRAKIERKLAHREREIAELRQTLVKDYARKPSTPAPPPAEEDTTSTQ